MSFLRSVTNMALGYAAARGVDHFRRSGGSKGMKEKLAAPQTADQLGDMLGRFGVPGGREKARSLLSRFSDPQSTASGATEDGTARQIGGPDMVADPDKQQAGLAAMLGAYGDRDNPELLDKMSGAAEPSADEEARARLMLRAMIQAAKSDGKIDEAEKARIMKSVGRDATEDELAFIKEELSKTVSADALAADTPHGDRAAVYIASVTAIDPDHEAEIAYLKSLSEALGLTEEERAGLHERIGAAPLPA